MTFLIFFVALSTTPKTTSMNHFAERLRSARKIKGWSLQELADNLSVSITKQSLSKYESGEMKPGSEVLIALARALGVKPAFFMSEPKFNLPEVEFRKKNSLSDKKINSVIEITKDLLERYLEVEGLLNIKPNFSNPIKDFIIESEADVDKAAIKLIKSWHLGFDPIPSVIEMLEENGVRVIEIDAPDSFDGLSTKVGEVPVVVINKNFTIERKRFTALHELGHLVLNISPDADKEKICHTFAGAMLLPDNCLNKMLGDKRNNIAFGELQSIKEQYGISAQAIMQRAYHKGIINETSLQKFYRTLGKNRKEDGLGSFRGIEKSYRFEHMVFRLAAEDIVSLSKAASLAGVKLAEFKDRLDAIEP